MYIWGNIMKCIQHKPRKIYYKMNPNIFNKVLLQKKCQYLNASKDIWTTIWPQVFL